MDSRPRQRRVLARRGRCRAGWPANLEQKADKVSQACQASLTDKAQAVESGCKPDLEQFCKDVQHGEGRLLQCLAKNEANLSADCKAFWSTAKSKTKK